MDEEDILEERRGWVVGELGLDGEMSGVEFSCCCILQLCRSDASVVGRHVDVKAPFNIDYSI
jgi:hypothetical protein